ncbi:MAG TPA: 4'-phosphopantetheinyl transferase superfamily protein [Bdellovibrio sp.]|nr:4'-phosphopantetheinyl transferase superfamily protein [Bdellovibrio sp.]
MKLERLESQLRLLLNSSDLQILMDPLWGSQNPSHRELIRQKISELNSDGKKYSSISHTEGLGIFALASLPLGVDVEVAQRVKESTVGRISSSKELNETPSAAALWCAKEAAFKALKMFRQPSVISGISIGGWQKIDSQFETFQLLNASEYEAPLKSHGVVVIYDEYVLSFFVFYS